jgi:hypothetical protein
MRGKAIASTWRTPQAEPEPLLAAAVQELASLRLALVDRGGGALWNEYIDRYHYLGSKPRPGAQLRYFAYAGERLVGLLGLGAAAWKIGKRTEKPRRHPRQPSGGEEEADSDFFSNPMWADSGSGIAMVRLSETMRARGSPVHYANRPGKRPPLRRRSRFNKA